MSWFSLFGSSNTDNVVKELYAKGAVVLDVRSDGEFCSGHIEGAKNIPLHNLQNQIGEIKKWNKPVISCCKSGARSGMAESYLKQQGIECVNGGSWQQVKSAIE